MKEYIEKTFIKVEVATYLTLISIIGLLIIIPIFDLTIFNIDKELEHNESSIESLKFNLQKTDNLIEIARTYEASGILIGAFDENTTNKSRELLTDRIKTYYIEAIKGKYFSVNNGIFPDKNYKDYLNNQSINNLVIVSNDYTEALRDIINKKTNELEILKAYRDYLFVWRLFLYSLFSVLVVIGSAIFSIIGIKKSKL